MRNLAEISKQLIKIANELVSEPTEDTNMTLWESFIDQVALTSTIPHELKPAAVAQAIQETGRGKSFLAKNHMNFFGMKWRDELAEFATPVEVEVSSEPSGRGVFCHFEEIHLGICGYRRFIDRAPYEGWESYVRDAAGFLRHIGGTWAADPDYTRACLGHLAEARALLEKRGWRSEVIGGRLEGKTFLVDAGHSRSAQGASSRDKRVTEYSMTSMMAGIIAERLRAVGATVDLFDPNPDSLTAVGNRAKGKTAAVFVHLNAANADGNDEGTEVFVHGAASAACRSFAAAMCNRIVTVLGTRNRGVKTAGYTVLVKAREVGCEYAVLPESFFLDDWTDAGKIADRCTKAAHAIADTVIETFG